MAQRKQELVGWLMLRWLGSTIPAGGQMCFSLCIESEAFIQTNKRSHNSCCYGELRCTSRRCRRVGATTRRCLPVAASSLATVMACSQVSRRGYSLGLLSALWPQRRTRLCILQQQVRSTAIPHRINRFTIPASSSLPELWTEEDNYQVNFLSVRSKAAVTNQEVDQISTGNATHPTVLPTPSSV